jgi:hypothetical protein
MSLTFDPTFYNASFLQVAPSTIKGAGNGVFTTEQVEQGQIIGQYFGSVYHKGAKVPYTPANEDRGFCTRSNATILPAPECVGQYINDCLNIESVESIALEGLYEICQEYNKAAFTIADARTVVREALKMGDPEVIDFMHQHGDEAGELQLVLDYNVDWEEHRGQVYIVSKRQVEQGEELFIDYGTEYWVGIVVKQLRTKYFDLWIESAAKRSSVGEGENSESK